MKKNPFCDYCVKYSRHVYSGVCIYVNIFLSDSYTVFIFAHTLLFLRNSCFGKDHFSLRSMIKFYFKKTENKSEKESKIYSGILKRHYSSKTSLIYTGSKIYQDIKTE